MPSLKKVIQTASRGADLYFVFRFLRLLTAKYTATKAYKLGIIDKKGKPLKKSSDLTTSEEKSSYTMLHRLTWKIRGLIEKIPLIGKSILLNYAAALFLLKEQKDPRIWTDEGYMKRKLMEFIETDWETDAQLLKEEVDNMEKKSFQFLRETAVETEASTYRDRTKDDEKEKKRKGGKIPPSQKGSRWGRTGYGKGHEEVEVEEGSSDTTDMYKLMTKGMKQVPGSPKQKETIKQINVIRKRMGMPLMKEAFELTEMKWEAGKVYHLDFGGGEISYFRADSLLKNRRWKGMAVDEYGGKQKKPRNITADEKVQGWKITPKDKIPKGLKEEIEEGVTGPTRMEIQKYFDKEKGTQRARLNATASAFNIYDVVVNKEGTVVGYQLDKRHYTKFKEEVELKSFSEFEEEVELDEMFFRITIPDLPPVFVEGDSGSKIRRSMKLKLRPDVFKDLDVERVSRADMAKKYRSLAKAEKEEEEDEVKEEFDEVAPPGWEGTVKKMKKDKNIDNPWALAWWMKSKGYKSNANEEVWHREQKALEEDFVSNNMGAGNIQYRSPLLFSKKKQKLVKRNHPAGTMMAYEEVEIEEAVLVNRDYKYDGKKIHISKKNFSKVHRDFKNATKGKEMMLTYDSKWGTVSVPVEFTEEVEEASTYRDKEKDRHESY